MRAARRAVGADRRGRAEEEDANRLGAASLCVRWLEWAMPLGCATLLRVVHRCRPQTPPLVRAARGLVRLV